MTTAQLSKLMKGKAAADARRRTLQRQQVEDYRAWILEEARRHRSANYAELTYGIGSAEHLAARRDWLRTWEQTPPCPPDSAWREAA